MKCHKKIFLFIYKLTYLSKICVSKFLRNRVACGAQLFLNKARKVAKQDAPEL